MRAGLPRLLLALAAVLLLLAGLMHASSYDRLLADIAVSQLSAEFAEGFKVLWLADSATCIALSLVFGFVVARPGAALGAPLMLLAAIPAAIALLLYNFMGSFIGAHILMTAAVAAWAAGSLRVGR